ncbi:MAG: hypothetical protein DMD67_13385 [Gemmatimonadetes bacterium]|nr:MAG: hypothetical protein DMD67_13385 [Gemmatimonadota bacterium]
MSLNRISIRRLGPRLIGFWAGARPGNTTRAANAIPMSMTYDFISLSSSSRGYGRGTADAELDGLLPEPGGGGRRGGGYSAAFFKS